MAFPILHRLLFGNDGAGPTLRTDILPAATADTPGAVMTGEGITNTSGKISIDLSPYAKKDELSSLLAAAVTQAVTQAVAEAKLSGHPVGSYYWSSESTDPSALFGGTWEQVKDRFVLAAGGSYAVGAVGGTASSSHTHQYGMAIDGALEGGTTPTGWTNPGVGTVHRDKALSAEQADIRNTALIKSTANTSAATVDNMPPYVAAYCWKRTA